MLNSFFYIFEKVYFNVLCLKDNKHGIQQVKFSVAKYKLILFDSAGWYLK